MTTASVILIKPWSQQAAMSCVAPSKCENAVICEKVAKCEKYLTLNVKIDAKCDKITLNVKK